MRSAGATKNADRLRALIEKEARAAGFDTVAVTKPRPGWGPAERLAEFLRLGRHGTMEWMAEMAERRSAPEKLWPEVRSIIVMGMNYGPKVDPQTALKEKTRGIISVYAQNRDYHDVI